MAWKSRTPHVNTSRSRSVEAPRDRAYDVRLVGDLFGRDLHCLEEVIADRRSLIVTSSSVGSLYGRRLHETLLERGHAVSLLVIDCDEASKNLELVSHVCGNADRAGIDRTGLLIGLGGGVCTDIVTVSASWFRRGIEYIRIPTTLVGQIDAGIGVKGGVNFEGKKNFLGCFHPPARVLIDPMFLRTLPVRHIRCGLAEIVKIALACDARLFEQVEQHWTHLMVRRLGQPHPSVWEILWRSSLRLLEELEPNLYEDQSLQRIADLGHTFSPPLEAASNFLISHGEAVAIDMALSAALATRLGLLADSVRDRILRLLRTIGLPVWDERLTLDLCLSALEEAARHRGGSPNLVLPVDIGRTCFVTDINRLPISDFEAALEWVSDFGGSESFEQASPAWERTLRQRGPSFTT